jgi:hypothetical protein
VLVGDSFYFTKFSTIYAKARDEIAVFARGRAGQSILMRKSGKGVEMTTTLWSMPLRNSE